MLERGGLKFLILFFINKKKTDFEVPVPIHTGCPGRWMSPSQLLLSNNKQKRYIHYWTQQRRSWD
jgi:hypothetical protein